MFRNGLNDRDSPKSKLSFLVLEFGENDVCINGRDC